MYFSLLEPEEPPAKKIKRRKRTLTEGSATDNHHSETVNLFDSYQLVPSTAQHSSSILEGHSIDSFRVSSAEKLSVQNLRLHGLNTTLYRLHHPIKSLHSYLEVVMPKPYCEVSIYKYLQILDERADCTDTVCHVLSELHQEFIVKHGARWLVIAGDQKIYDLLLHLKTQHGPDLKWLVPFPGKSKYNSLKPGCM